MVFYCYVCFCNNYVGNMQRVPNTNREEGGEPKRCHIHLDDDMTEAVFFPIFSLLKMIIDKKQ